MDICWVELGQLGPESAKFELAATFGQFQPDLARHRPSANFGPNPTNFGANSADIVQLSLEKNTLGQISPPPAAMQNIAAWHAGHGAQTTPHRAMMCAMLLKKRSRTILRPTLADSGFFLPAELARFGRVRFNFVHRPDFDWFRHHFRQHRPHRAPRLSRRARIWTEVGATGATLGGGRRLARDAQSRPPHGLGDPPDRPAAGAARTWTTSRPAFGYPPPTPWPGIGQTRPDGS